MKTLHRTLLFTALAVFSLTSYAQCPQEKSCGTNCTPEGYPYPQSTEVPYIEVAGESTATITPNKIDVNITLSEEPSKGKVKLSTLESNLAKALKSGGFDVKKDLKVVSQSSKSAKKKDTYQYKVYTISVRDNSELATLFSEIAEKEAGVAAVTRIINDSTDKVRMQLRIEAVANARIAAETLASALGQQLGMAIKVTDYSGGGEAVAYNSYPVMLRAGAMDMDGNTPSIPTDVDMRPISLSQRVTVRFQLLPPTPCAEQK
ncbi:MAG: SIMPL domain-containing protein [Rikenellaceae bacterium]